MNKATRTMVITTVVGLCTLGAYGRGSSSEVTDIKELPSLEKLNTSGTFEKNMGVRWRGSCKSPLEISSQLVKETRKLPALEGKGYLEVKMTGGAEEYPLNGGINAECTVKPSRGRHFILRWSVYRASETDLDMTVPVVVFFGDTYEDRPAIMQGKPRRIPLKKWETYEYEFEIEEGLDIKALRLRINVKRRKRTDMPASSGILIDQVSLTQSKK